LLTSRDTPAFLFGIQLIDIRINDVEPVWKTPDFTVLPLPSGIISHVLLRILPNFRDVGELAASRGVFVTYETIREWTPELGQQDAKVLHGVSRGEAPGGMSTGAC
jgi:hypothetical protein